MTLYAQLHTLKGGVTIISSTTIMSFLTLFMHNHRRTNQHGKSVNLLSLTLLYILPYDRKKV